MKILSVFFVFMIALIGSLSAQIDTNDDQKLSLNKAEDLIKNEFYKDSKKLKVVELTTDEVWDKMSTQIYRVEGDEILFYAINGEKVSSLGGSYSYDLDFVVTDLDNDGNYELVYTYQFGSGVSRGVVGAYSTVEQIAVDESFTAFNNYSILFFNFDKISNNNVTVEVKTAEETLKTGKLGLMDFDGIKILMLE
ncbi:MAG: hypothetical protein JXL97_18795 [Bacteroidales bacterium]|nr:hypothetical protein [Bacteroidales bacterium]